SSDLLDGVVAREVRLLFRPQQAAENGIAVELRQAGPHHHALLVDQGRDLAIADDTEVEVAHSFDCSTGSGGARARIVRGPAPAGGGEPPRSALPAGRGTDPYRRYREPCSHFRSSAVLEKCQRAAVSRESPMRTDMPPISLTARKPSSSVRSSPTNTGRRPANGGISMNVRIALPLLAAAGVISTTIFPRSR